MKKPTPALFPELFQAAERAKAAHEDHWLAGVRSAGIPGASAIAIHPAQTIGSYQVQPVEILDPKNAGNELNRWMFANGFGSVPAQNQRYYLRKGAVFLCIKIHGLHGSFSDIKPLHIVYKSDLLTLPLKFSTHSGTFNVELYLFTPQAVNPGILTASGLNGDDSTQISRAHDAPHLWQTVGRRAGFLTRFEGYGYNGSGLMVRDLKADPAIDLRRNNSPRLGASFPAGLLIAAAAAVMVLGMIFQRRVHSRRSAGT